MREGIDYYELVEPSDEERYEVVKQDLEEEGSEVPTFEEFQETVLDESPNYSDGSEPND